MKFPAALVALLVANLAVPAARAQSASEIAKTTLGRAGFGLVWFPHSSFALYGKTADVLTALNAGMTVAASANGRSASPDRATANGP